MEKLRILLVDDEQDFVESVVKRLNDRGLDAGGVTSGSQALNLLDTQDFDVAILDYRMPEMDGVEALREMKKKRPRMSFIMLTGQSVSDLGVQGLQLPDQNFVVKPVSIDDLVKLIHQVHQRKLKER
jgi:DNA-binding NtrC family response regulator